MRVAISLMLMLLCAARGQAATYYVSAVGSDLNSCATATGLSTSSQKRTLSAGVACAVSGDTVYIHGGTSLIPTLFTGNLNTIDSQTYPVNSGSSYGSPITIGAYPGEYVVLQPPSNVSAVRLTTGTPHYLIIQDLRIDMINTGAFAEGIFAYQAHHIRFQRLDVKNGYGFGIHIADSTPNIELLDSRVHDIGDPAGGVIDGHGLYWSGSNATITGNEIDNNMGYGIHLYCNTLCPGIEPSNNVISNNRVHHNGRHGGTAYGIVVSWGSNNLVVNNLVYQNPGGVLVYTNSTSSKVYQNSIYSNTPYEGVAMQFYGSAPSLVNNIVYANGTNIQDFGGGTGTPSLVANVLSNPNFTNPGGNDFTLQAGPAVDVGACAPGVTTDYTGASRAGKGLSCDAGAYERGTTGSTPTVTTTMLPSGNQGAMYSQLICSTGGTPPIAWITTGTLPAGTTLSALTSTCATLSGTLGTPGTYPFTARVTDSAALFATQAFSVDIVAVSSTCSGMSGAWTIVTNSCVNGGSPNGIAAATTGTVTMSVNDLALCAVAQDKSQAQVYATDSIGGNTWVAPAGAVLEGEFGRISLQYSRIAVGGTGHFTADSGGNLAFAALQCALLQGSKASPLDQIAAGGSVTAGSSVSAGSITTAQNWTLTATALSAEDANIVAASGFAVYQLGYSLDHYFGVALGLKISATTETNVPTWAWSSPMSASAPAGTFLSADSYVPKYRLRRR